MSYNLLPLQTQFTSLVSYLRNLRDSPSLDETTQPTYLIKMLELAMDNRDFSPDKTCRWLGYCYGVLVATDARAHSHIFSFVSPSTSEDFSSEPLIKASNEVLQNLKDIISSKSALRQEMVEGSGNASCHQKEIYSYVSDIIETTMKYSRHLGVEKTSLQLGYIQGFMVAKSLLDVDKEREKTRPIFHRAYRELGMVSPPSFGVKRGEVDG